MFKIIFKHTEELLFLNIKPAHTGLRLHPPE